MVKMIYSHPHAMNVLQPRSTAVNS